jgi:4-hydroxybenzoyl-CoA thioesterase
MTPSAENIKILPPHDFDLSQTCISRIGDGEAFLWRIVGLSLVVDTSAAFDIAKSTRESRVMLEDQFVPPNGAFTRSVPIRFSHCDPAGIVYFPHYFDMFNGLIEDWYGQELGYDYAELITGRRYGFPFVHIECDFKIPSRIGEVIDLTLLIEGIGRSSLAIAIVCHRDNVVRLRARMVTAMMSLESKKAVAMPQGLREAIESYRQRTAPAAGEKHLRD